MTVLGNGTIAYEGSRIAAGMFGATITTTGGNYVYTDKGWSAGYGASAARASMRTDIFSLLGITDINNATEDQLKQTNAI